MTRVLGHQQPLTFRLRAAPTNAGLASSEKKHIRSPPEDGENDDKEEDIGNRTKYWRNNGNGAERFGERQLLWHGTQWDKEKTGGQK